MSCNSQNKPIEQNMESFKIIGISLETTNQNGQSVEDMGQLWQQFLSQQLANKIPNALSPEIYVLYTDYKSDYMGKYRAIIGCKVATLDTIPKGMLGRVIEGGTYTKYTAKGEVPASVVSTWQQIWKADDSLKRSYTTDFEVYGAKSQQGIESEVEIFIAINQY